MDIKIFLKENNIKTEKIEFVVTDRFKDENGKPIKWILKVLTNKELEDLKVKNTIKRTTVKGSNFDFDNKSFSRSMILSCIVEPNLYNKELQDSYDTLDAYELLQELLTVGEMTRLEEKILELHNYEEKREKEIEKIKN